MSVNNQYCVYVGTVRGALAYTQCKPEESANFVLEDLEKAEITSMEWGRSENEIVVGHKNGVVKLYSTLNNKYTKTLNDLEGEGSVAGVGIIEKNIVVGRRSGYINVWSKMDVDTYTFSTNLQDESTMDCMVQNCNNSNVVGTGGACNDLKLWDVETKQPIFKAKSMGHDELNLPIPTSVRGICFFLNENNLVSCATKEGHVLLYDDRAQRRPVTKFLEPKASYSAISTAYKERQCVVGTTKGYIQLLDLRSAKCLKTYKSFTGGVTSLVCDSLSPVVLSTSLDRFLRIHNLETKELLYKKYMKQSLTKVIMKPIVKEEDVIEVEKDEEYEELFENMETVSEKLKKRKKVIQENKIEIAHKKKKKLSLN